MPNTHLTTNLQADYIASALSTLATYKRRIDDDIASYCDQLLAQTGEHFSQYSQDAMQVYCSILRRGGKRLRGALMLNAYYMMGGTNHEAALRVARVLEMVHAYLLIVDDIADHSVTRRGDYTAHILLQDYHQQQQLHGDNIHFGRSAATSAALTAMHQAMYELGTLHAPAEARLAMLNNLNENLVITGHGQVNDLFNEAVQAVDEAQVQRMLTWKTAYYSFLNPLQMGALLAEADRADFGVLQEYSLHIGLAFQIVDDILGTFGNDFESGKSAQDDLREGKVTLLVSRALAHAAPEQRHILLACLGKTDLTPAEYEQCKQIIESTGALDYARSRAAEHAEKAVLALEAAPAEWSASHLDFLRGIASYVTSRSA